MTITQTPSPVEEEKLKTVKMKTHKLKTVKRNFFFRIMRYPWLAISKVVWPVSWFSFKVSWKIFWALASIMLSMMLATRVA